jgi:hypothetical protein
MLYQPIWHKLQRRKVVGNTGDAVSCMVICSRKRLIRSWRRRHIRMPVSVHCGRNAFVRRHSRCCSCMLCQCQYLLSVYLMCWGSFVRSSLSQSLASEAHSNLMIFVCNMAVLRSKLGLPLGRRSVCNLYHRRNNSG